MDVTHTFSLPLHINQQRLDPCISREWIALPLTQKSMGLWKSEVSKAEKSNSSGPVELKGHESEICAYILSSKFPTHFLASACKAKVLVWDIQAISQNPSNLTAKKKIDHKCNEIYALCFNNSDDILAIAADRKILIWKFMLSEPLKSIDAHKAMITKLKFCPHYSATLVSISDDRSFCVWNVSDMILLYQSSIISSSPLISIAMNLLHPHVVIGTADGCLKMFDLTDGNNFRLLTSLDLSLSLMKKVESNVITQFDTYSENSKRDLKHEYGASYSPIVIQSSESVLSVDFVYFPQNSSLIAENHSIPIVQNSSIRNMLEEKPPSLVAITTNAIVLINSKTFQILDTVHFQLPLKSLSFSTSVTVGTIAFAGISQINMCTLVAVVGAMIYNKMDVLKCVLFKHNSYNDAENNSESYFQEDTSLSTVPKMSLLSSSPLNCDILPQLTTKALNKGVITAGMKKSLNPLNQPLTFKSKIKSSGYLLPARTTMFTPQTDRSSLLNLRTSNANKQSSAKRSLANKTLKSEYDVSKGPPVEYYGTFQIDTQTTAVPSLRFSDDGEKLGCALTNKFGLIIKSPFREELAVPLIGHNNVVNSVYFSKNSSYVLTASNDKTVLIWRMAGGDPIMRLTHQRGSMKESIQDKSTVKVSSASTQRKSSTVKSASSSLSHLTLQDNLPYTKEIKNAQFFYVDKFILVTHGSDLNLYKYYLSDEKDDVKRYQTRNRYKLISSWQVNSSTFTSMAAVNTFYSYIVICTTSGRNIEIYDLNKSCMAHSFMDCHTRPAHCTVINESSCFSTQPQEALNVFATTAPTDSIKLWDMRSKSNVQSMQGHLNKAHSCQIAFSPCGNYIATGSEDRLVYLYDLRMGTYCDRLRGHNEVVTSVAFHPAKPFLATGSLNSKLLFFKAI